MGITCTSETKWCGENVYKTDGFTVVHSGCAGNALSHCVRVVLFWILSCKQGAGIQGRCGQ